MLPLAKVSAIMPATVTHIELIMSMATCDRTCLWPPWAARQKIEMNLSVALLKVAKAITIVTVEWSLSPAFLP